MSCKDKGMRKELRKKSPPKRASICCQKSDRPQPMLSAWCHGASACRKPMLSAWCPQPRKQSKYAVELVARPCCFMAGYQLDSANVAGLLALRAGAALERHALVF